MGAENFTANKDTSSKEKIYMSSRTVTGLAGLVSDNLYGDTKEDKETNDIIDQIEKIRRKNNKLWVGLLRLAFRHAPKEARKIMKKITKNDREVSRWTGRL